MNKVQRVIEAAAWLAMASTAIGGERLCTTNRGGANAQATSIVPFAVPVAVPVAVVQSPAVFYSYGAFASYAPPPTSTSAASPTAGAADVTSAETAIAPPTIDSRATAILRQHCAACHSGQAARGALAIFDGSGLVATRLPRQAIVEAAAPDADGRQAMPPGNRTKLSADEIGVLQQWAKPPRALLY